MLKYTFTKALASNNQANIIQKSKRNFRKDLVGCMDEHICEYKNHIKLGHS